MLRLRLPRAQKSTYGSATLLTTLPFLLDKFLFGWFDGRGEYVCPHCWVQGEKVESRATLIVSPSSISFQWIQEIQKHVKHKVLKGTVSRKLTHHVAIHFSKALSFWTAINKIKNI